MRERRGEREKGEIEEEKERDRAERGRGKAEEEQKKKKKIVRKRAAREDGQKKHPKQQYQFQAKLLYPGGQNRTRRRRYPINRQLTN